MCQSSTTMKSIRNRSDLVLFKRHFVQELIVDETMMLFLWIPSHTGQSDNEWANELAKQAENDERKNRQHIDISIIC